VLSSALNASFAPAAALTGVSNAADMAASYFQLCGQDGQVVSTAGVAVAGGAARSSGQQQAQLPYLQVDLGRLCVVSDVQLWSGVAYGDWLGPFSVYVTNGSSLTPADRNLDTYYPCWTYLPATGAANAWLRAAGSLQHACAGTGRYVTVQATAANAWEGGGALATVRLCQLMVFGQAVPPPSPPPPAPAPPASRKQQSRLGLDWRAALGIILGGLAVLSLLALKLVSGRVGEAEEAGGGWRRRREEEEKAAPPPPQGGWRRGVALLARAQGAEAAPRPAPSLNWPLSGAF